MIYFNIHNSRHDVVLTRIKTCLRVLRKFKYSSLREKFVTFFNTANYCFSEMDAFPGSFLKLRAADINLKVYITTALDWTSQIMLSSQLCLTLYLTFHQTTKNSNTHSFGHCFYNRCELAFIKEFWSFIKNAFPSTRFLWFWKLYWGRF